MDLLVTSFKIIFNLKFQRFQSNTNFKNSEKISNIPIFKSNLIKFFRIRNGTTYSVPKLFGLKLEHQDPIYPSSSPSINISQNGIK